MKILFKRMVSAVQKDEDFLRTDNLSRSNGCRFFSNGQPQPFEWMKILFERMTSTIRTDGDFFRTDLAAAV